MNYFRRFSLAVMWLMLCGWPAHAQDEPVILTLGVESWMLDTFTGTLLDGFEAEHPGVQVVVVPLAEHNLTPPKMVETVDEFVQQARDFAAQADVLLVDSTMLSAEFLRTGALLNITPLLAADATANLDDFYPALLDSFRWDNAVWGLPVGGSLGLLLYDAYAFDTAGLAYPNTRWTLADFVTAGNMLAAAAQNGQIESGLLWLDPPTLFRALLGREIALTKTAPPLPVLDDPELPGLLDTWLPFYRAEQAARDAGENFLAGPLLIGDMFLANNSLGDRNYTASLLPGESAAVLNVQGFAVSAGTTYPELAYRLAQHFTHQPEAALYLHGDAPARRSVEALMAAGRPAETQALIAAGLANAIPLSDEFYFTYTRRALEQMAQDNLDARTALQIVQQDVYRILAAVTAAAENSPAIVVAPPPAPPASDGDEAVLRFNLEEMESPLPNRTLWDAAAAAFVAQDSQVGQVVVDTRWLSFADYAAQYDCFYLNDNAVSSADLSLVLDIEPLLAADPYFVEADMVAGTMSQVRSQGGTWALPVTLYPLVIWYNREILGQAGVPEPISGWDITTLENTLRQLAQHGDGAPFRTETWGETTLLMLIAAYGGRLFDNTTEPTSFYLDDPIAIAATQQALDLGRAGLFHYQALGTNYGGFFNINDRVPIYSGYLTTFGYRMQQRAAGDPYRAVTFPRGSRYTPMSYQLGTAYVSAATSYPEACYRWLRYVTSQPELWSGMPAQRSLLDEAALMFSAGEDLLALYRVFDAALQRPDVLIFGSIFSGSYGDNLYSQESAHFITGMGNLWMRRAFDSYVLADADLTEAMTTAQQYIAEYTECIVAITPPAHPLEQLDNAARQAYFDRFTNCALVIDPSLESLYQQ
ncbi:MAG: extracellular solute-binding protein [Anaerolineaceae bacterium]|nr:extracellular solute-binding protein [Anaerolineaceae bacterium]